MLLIIFLMQENIDIYCPLFVLRHYAICLIRGPAREAIALLVLDKNMHKKSHESLLVALGFMPEINTRASNFQLFS